MSNPLDTLPRRSRHIFRILGLAFTLINPGFLLAHIQLALRLLLLLVPLLLFFDYITPPELLLQDSLPSVRILKTRRVIRSP